MAEKRVQLYERLPEIYKIKDEEQDPPGQLRNYIGLVEEIFDAIYEDIDSLYDNLFIETCDNWVIPYIGDLVGTSHLKGDPWTLRADVANTIALRRRKGTLGAIEQLTYDLTQWGVHCVELRENMVWNQHLNHQRPDTGGKPPYTDRSQIEEKERSMFRTRAIRGGTVTLRDPAILSLVNTPLDPFAHTADLRTPSFGSIRYNLPDLAVFLWRLKAYRITESKPVSGGVHPSRDPEAASYIVRFDIHPMGEPIRLFNMLRFDPDEDKPNTTQINELTLIDETPEPIPAARLTQDSASGAPDKYISISSGEKISEMGLHLHLPKPEFSDVLWPLPSNSTASNGWSIRGANLCAWEKGLQSPLKENEVAIDPLIGRIVIGANTQEKANALVDRLLISYTYGAVGGVGAHPVSRPSLPNKLDDKPLKVITISHTNLNILRDTLKSIENSASPIAIQFEDSMIYDLDVDVTDMRLNKSLILRAADGQRPIIKLAKPLSFAPTNTNDAKNITVRLEGLYITSSSEPLIERAALNSLEIISCTLDPGGSEILDCTEGGTRTLIRASMKLQNEEGSFTEIPEIKLYHSIVGPLFIDSGYRLSLEDSIIDAGSGVNKEPENASFALSGITEDVNASKEAYKYGPETVAKGITVFGRMRVERISGSGGIWVHTLEVLDNQKGCIKFSYFSGNGDRLPQNYACVKGTEAKLRFTSEIFGNPGYGQLTHTTDFRIRERGPNDDAMGAFGFLLEAHKWRNLQIRYREFMPVGIRLLMIPVT